MELNLIDLFYAIDAKICVVNAQIEENERIIFEFCTSKDPKKWTHLNEFDKANENKQKLHTILTSLMQMKHQIEEIKIP